MAKQKLNEYLERCVCKEEADTSLLKNRLIPKQIPHEKNPKWVAILGTRPNCSVLGKRKNYTHKLVFEMQQGTIEWLRPFEAKPDNEPNSFEIPIEELARFNTKIIKVSVQDNSKFVQRRKKK